jgi:hypothetical protein
LGQVGGVGVLEPSTTAVVLDHWSVNLYEPRPSSAVAEIQNANEKTNRGGRYFGHDIGLHSTQEYRRRRRILHETWIFE